MSISRASRYGQQEDDLRLSDRFSCSCASSTSSTGRFFLRTVASRSSCSLIDSDRRVLYGRECTSDGRACDGEGALEDWKRCDTGVPRRIGTRGLCVAKLSSDRGPIGTGPPAELLVVGSHSWEAHDGGSAFTT